MATTKSFTDCSKCDYNFELPVFSVKICNEHKEVEKLSLYACSLYWGGLRSVVTDTITLLPSPHGMNMKKFEYDLLPWLQQNKLQNYRICFSLWHGDDKILRAGPLKDGLIFDEINVKIAKTEKLKSIHEHLESDLVILAPISESTSSTITKSVASIEYKIGDASYENKLNENESNENELNENKSNYNLNLGEVESKLGLNGSDDKIPTNEVEKWLRNNNYAKYIDNFNEQGITKLRGLGLLGVRDLIDMKINAEDIKNMLEKFVPILLLATTSSATISSSPSPSSILFSPSLSSATISFSSSASSLASPSTSSPLSTSPSTLPSTIPPSSSTTLPTIPPSLSSTIISTSFSSASSLSSSSTSSAFAAVSTTDTVTGNKSSITNITSTLPGGKAEDNMMTFIVELAKDTKDIKDTEDIKDTKEAKNNKVEFAIDRNVLEKQMGIYYSCIKNEKSHTIASHNCNNPEIFKIVLMMMLIENGINETNIYNVWKLCYGMSFRNGENFVAKWIKHCSADKLWCDGVFKILLESHYKKIFSIAVDRFLACPAEVQDQVLERAISCDRFLGELVMRLHERTNSFSTSQWKSINSQLYAPCHSLSITSTLTSPTTSTTATSTLPSLSAKLISSATSTSLSSSTISQFISSTSAELKSILSTSSAASSAALSVTTQSVSSSIPSTSISQPRSFTMWSSPSYYYSLSTSSKISQSSSSAAARSTTSSALTLPISTTTSSLTSPALPSTSSSSPTASSSSPSSSSSLSSPTSTSSSSISFAASSAPRIISPAEPAKLILSYSLEEVDVKRSEKNNFRIIGEKSYFISGNREWWVPRSMLESKSNFFKEILKSETGIVLAEYQMDKYYCDETIKVVIGLMYGGKLTTANITCHGQLSRIYSLCKDWQIESGIEAIHEFILSSGYYGIYGVWYIIQNFKDQIVYDHLIKNFKARNYRDCLVKYANSMNGGASKFRQEMCNIMLSELRCASS